MAWHTVPRPICFLRPSSAADTLNNGTAPTVQQQQQVRLKFGKVIAGIEAVISVVEWLAIVFVQGIIVGAIRSQAGVFISLPLDDTQGALYALAVTGGLSTALLAVFWGYFVRVRYGHLRWSTSPGQGDSSVTISKPSRTLIRVYMMSYAVGLAMVLWNTQEGQTSASDHKCGLSLANVLHESAAVEGAGHSSIRLDVMRLLLAVLISPIQEEVVFRWIVPNLLRRRDIRPGSAAVWSGLLFSAVHLLNLLSSTYSAGYVMIQLVLAVTQGIAYSLIALIEDPQGTHVLPSTVKLHILNNFASLCVPTQCDIFTAHWSLPVACAFFSFRRDLSGTCSADTANVLVHAWFILHWKRVLSNGGHVREAVHTKKEQ